MNNPDLNANNADLPRGKTAAVQYTLGCLYWEEHFLYRCGIASIFPMPAADSENARRRHEASLAWQQNYLRILKDSSHFRNEIG